MASMPDRVERICGRLRALNGQLSAIIGQVRGLVQGAFSNYCITELVHRFANILELVVGPFFNCCT